MHALCASCDGALPTVSTESGYDDTQYYPVGVVEELYVQPANRRIHTAATGGERVPLKGVGSALLEAAQSCMKAAGMKRMKLQASVYNADAIAFYEKHGWRTRQVLMYRNDEEGGRADSEADWLNATTTTIINTGVGTAALNRAKL